MINLNFETFIYSKIMKTIIKIFPGLVLIAAVSALAIFSDTLISRWVKFEAVTISIVLSITLNNIFTINEIFIEGINFTNKKLLKAGIILLGFKLNVDSILGLGYRVFIVILLYVLVSLILSVLLGKLFKLNKKTALLIGAGSSICGASAVVALSPCLKANKDNTIIAVTVINILGAFGVLLYSFLALKPGMFNEYQYGTWSGLTLHGVAHAIAAAFAMGKEAGEAGTVIKMARVLMIIPVSILFAMISRRDNGNNKKIDYKNILPGYVFLFITAVVINSVFTPPESVITFISFLSSSFILAAMTGLGFSIKLKSTANEGLKALLAGLVLFVILSLSGYYAVVKLF
jgi:uncharacterized integral membrane protein (TIGR00698 family)